MGKLRPALVIAIAPGRHPDYLLAEITSQAHQESTKIDVVIDPADPDYGTSKLKTRSIIRLSRLASIELSVIKGRLGRVSRERMQHIHKLLCDWL